MSRFTKQAIIDSFLKIAAKKTVGKITVRDIVEDCGVNRNTFYYYFSDVYSLLDELFICETEKATLKTAETGSLAEGCAVIVEWIRENRDAFRNIYSSMGRESLEYAVSKALDGVMEGYIRKKAEGLTVSETDVMLVTGVCRNIFLGTLFDWIKRSMRGDPLEYFHRIEVLFEDAVFNALKRGATVPQASLDDGKQ